jgi:hypothetical protein
MRGWLVSVDGVLTPAKRSVLSNASIEVAAERHAGTGTGPMSIEGFTVEVEAEDPDQASVRVAEALGADGFSGFSVRDVKPSDG